MYPARGIVSKIWHEWQDVGCSCIMPTADIVCFRVALENSWRHLLPGLLQAAAGLGRGPVPRHSIFCQALSLSLYLF